MRWHFVGLGFVVGLMAASLSCGPSPKKCLPSNCNGCCAADDTCKAFPSDTTCGVNGAVCVSCSGGTTCVAGSCVKADGGTGGGATGGGSGGGATGGGTGGSSGTGGFVGGTGLVINEIDYDQPLSDTDEFVELLNTGSSAASLTGVSLVFVNGSNGNEYARVPLDSYGTLASGEYFVVGSSSVIATLPGGVRSASLANPQDNIQNGAPDGVALVQGTTLLDSLSYEGATSWDAGTGLIPLTEGAGSTASLADSNADAGSLARLPNGQDTNSNATDFAFTPTPTPGRANQ